MVVIGARGLLDRVDRWSSRTPDRLAHVSPDGRLTYAQLGRASDAVAAFIQRTLPEDGSPVVVLGHKQPEMLLGFLGSAKSGHPYVPLDSSLPPHRVQRVLETAGAALVLTVDLVRRAVREDATPRLVAADSERPYYLMFTSGSSGEPKGVTITLGCLESFLEWMLAEHAFADGREVFLNQAPFSFDLSVMDTYLSLVTGGTLVSLTSDDIAHPPRLFRVLAETGITTWVSTPSFAQFCLAERAFDASMLPHLRRFLFCGEVLPHSLASELLRRFPTAEVWNTYGPTEATVATTSVRVDRDVLNRHDPLPVGRPKRDSRILVVDSAGSPVADGERGEIVIAGPNVSPGYVNRPDLTARGFFNLDGLRAYRTGDRGHLEDGVLFFDGRIDSQIKLHGYRIEIGDVEANLRSVAGVRDAVVVPLCRHSGVDALAAFVIAEADPSEPEFQRSMRVRRALAERLPAYMLPRVLKLVAGFPMTANGKVDRRALAESLA